MAVKKRIIVKRVIPERCKPFGKPLEKKDVSFGFNKFKTLSSFPDGRLISAHSPKDGVAHIGYIDGEHFVSRQVTHVNPDEITEFFKLDPQKRKIADGKIKDFEHFRTLELTAPGGGSLKNVKK